MWSSHNTAWTLGLYCVRCCTNMYNRNITSTVTEKAQQHHVCWRQMYNDTLSVRLMWANQRSHNNYVMSGQLKADFRQQTFRLKNEEEITTLPLSLNKNTFDRYKYCCWITSGAQSVIKKLTAINLSVSFDHATIGHTQTRISFTFRELSEI